jgi:hypothetical protein
MIEIVGAMINGGTVTNNLMEIAKAAKDNRIDEFYDRKHMQFMAELDLGRNWEAMASGPALLLIGDDGVPKWPKKTKSEGTSIAFK